MLHSVASYYKHRACFADRTCAAVFSFCESSLFGFPHAVEELDDLSVEGHGDRDLARHPGKSRRHAAVEGGDPLVLEHFSCAVHRGVVLGRVQPLHPALHHVDTLQQQQQPQGTFGSVGSVGFGLVWFGEVIEYRTA